MGTINRSSLSDKRWFSIYCDLIEDKKRNIFYKNNIKIIIIHVFIILDKWNTYSYCPHWHHSN